jgi:hypothetical protein
VAWTAPESCSAVTVEPLREETFLEGGSVGGFLEGAGSGTGEPLAGEAGLDPAGGTDEEVIFGEAVGTSVVFSRMGGTTEGSGRPV